MRKKGFVTLRDIADAAGLSVNSVSRALKDRGDIGEATKERVRRIASDLGYIPNAAASDLRSGASKSIGVVVTHIDNAFFSRILQGINDAVAEKGYTVLTLSSNEDEEAERRAVRLLSAYRVSGMIVVPANDLRSKVDYAEIPVPSIRIIRPGRGKRGDYFVSDSRLGGRLAAGRLLSLGRRRLAYLGFELPVSCNRDRQRGFEEAAKAGGAPEVRSRSCAATGDAAFEATSRWLKEGFDADGIFVYNDAMAFGVLRALADAGRRVPDDVAVVGHDDIDVARTFIPRLTTVQVPKYRLGSEAARALLERIEPGSESPLARKVVYQPELVVRET